MWTVTHDIVARRWAVLEDEERCTCGSDGSGWHERGCGWALLFRASSFAGAAEMVLQFELDLGEACPDPFHQSVYLSTSIERADQHRAVSLDLARRGIRVTDPWPDHVVPEPVDPELMRRAALIEHVGILTAHTTIYIGGGRRSSWMEIGLALGAGRPVLLWTDEDLPGFACHPSCTVVTGGLDELVSALQGQRRAA